MNMYAHTIYYPRNTNISPYCHLLSKIGMKIPVFPMDFEIYAFKEVKPHIFEVIISFEQNHTLEENLTILSEDAVLEYICGRGFVTGNPLDHKKETQIVIPEVKIVMETKKPTFIRVCKNVYKKGNQWNLVRTIYGSKLEAKFSNELAAKQAAELTKFIPPEAVSSMMENYVQRQNKNRRFKMIDNAMTFNTFIDLAEDDARKERTKNRARILQPDIF